MTVGNRIERGRQRRLKRHAVYAFICSYAIEHNGATPGLTAIAQAFALSYSTVRGHVAELAMEGLLRLENRQIVVEDSEWIPPDAFQRRCEN